MGAQYYQQRRVSHGESLKVELVSPSLMVFGLGQEEGGWRTNSGVNEGKLLSRPGSTLSLLAVSNSLPTHIALLDSLAAQMEGI